MNQDQAERGVQKYFEQQGIEPGPGKIYHLTCSDCGEIHGLCVWMVPDSWCQKCIKKYIGDG